MRKSFVVFGMLTSISIFKAQNVGISPTAAIPDPSAGLDVNFNDKGVLIPRVALTSNTDVTTIPSPQVSLLVYNTGSGGLTPAGFYYWDGTKWVKFATGTGGGGGQNTHCFTCDGF
jgi:hypothetical protein